MVIRAAHTSEDCTIRSIRAPGKVARGFGSLLTRATSSEGCGELQTAIHDKIFYSKLPSSRYDHPSAYTMGQADMSHPGVVRWHAWFEPSE